MLDATRILLRGYFHTKNEMTVVNIVEVIEQTRIRLQTDRQMDRWTDKSKPIYPTNYYIVRERIKISNFRKPKSVFQKEWPWT